MFKRSHTLLLLLGATLYTSPAVAAPAQGDAGALLDPMRPPATAAPASRRQGGAASNSGGYQLSAIRITAGQRSATLNGTTVTVGDRLGSARITAIQASSVTLQQGGKSRTISLLPLSIKKPVEAPQP